MRKGRKLNVQDVIAIRMSVEPYTALAARFNVSRKTIEAISRGATWPNVVPRRAKHALRDRVLIVNCERCNKPFEKRGALGSPRRFCEACRTFQAHSALEARIEKVVRKVLCEAGIIKAGNGKGSS